MTDPAYYDDESYEDDFTDDEEDDRGSSKGPTLNNNQPPVKKRNAFAGSATRQSSIRSDRRNMSRRGEGRVKSSKRRQQNNVRNQMAQLTINYEELLRENKILKQIQKRQERELDKYNNADEDLPRLLDANSYEIAGLKAKNKQLLFEKREMDDKLRRQHQEIMSLKDQSKKLNALINNKKLGEREKLEMELTTARVTIAHQENKIQDLTKATEIYKKTADRESRGGQLQLRKAQNNLRDLQDAYNELFLKYKVKEREAGNNNIYAQRARQPSKRSRRPGGGSLERSEVASTNPTTSKSSLLTTAGEDTRSKIEVASPRGRRISKESPLKSGSLERLEAELNALDQQEEALKSDSDIPEEETEKEKPVVEMVNKPRTKSPSAFSSDSEEETPAAPSKPNVEQKPSPVRDTGAEERRLAEEKRLKEEEEAEKERKAEAERLKEMERKRLAEEEERKRQEEAGRIAEIKKKEDAARKAKEEEEEKKRKEEQDLLDEKRRKDNEMKEKLAAMRANAGGDFMSQLKAKRNTPSISPSSSPIKSEGPKSPAAVAPITPKTTTMERTVERTARKSDSGDELRKAAVTNNVNGGRRKKSIEDYSTGYQPSFAPAPRAAGAGKRDPFGVDVGSEYTPSFSANQRISRESVRDKVWTPAGRASTSEKNGLFNPPQPGDQSKPLLKRRPSKSKNTIGPARVQSDEDIEELIL